MNRDKEPRVIFLDRGDYTSASVQLFGGNVTSWKIGNKEQLFVSRLAKFSQLESVTGGFCFSFPECGQWNFGPHFGFLKNIMWELEDGPYAMDNGDVWAKFSTTDDAYTRSFWNYSFKICYILTLHEKSITFDIMVLNYDDYLFFEFSFLLTGLFKLANIDECEVFGLEDALIKKKAYKGQPEHSMLALDCLEILYGNLDRPVYLTNLPGGGAMKIQGCNDEDILIFNPKYGNVPFKYMDTSHEIEDDEYPYFIGANIGTTRAVRLDPKAKWGLRVKFHRIFVPSKSTLKIYANFDDYFQGYC